MRRRTKYKEDYMQYIEVFYFDKFFGYLNKSFYVFVLLLVYFTFWSKRNVFCSFIWKVYIY